MTQEYNFDSMVGKTIERVEHHVSDYVRGITTITIHFTDGDTLDIKANGCDMGGWIDVNREYEVD